MQGGGLTYLMSTMVVRLPQSPAPRRVDGWGRLRSPGIVWRSASPYAVSVAALAVATIVGLVLTSFVSLPNVSMVLLLAVVFSAAWLGIWPALLASVLCFLAYNFFFIEPFHTFSVAQAHQLLALLVFLAIAVVTSTIAGQAREQARRATTQATAARRLYEFTRRLSALSDPKEVLDSAAVQVQTDLGRKSAVVLVAGGALTPSASSTLLDANAFAAARECCKTGEPCGAGTPRLPQVPWLFLPLRTPGEPAGAIGVSGPDLDSDERTLFETVAELTSTATARALLDQEITGARSAAETERVRNTLLASISHDFRTPLASILGAATGLIDYGAKLPEAARRDLLSQVKDEAEHLDGMVRNLLAVTRVEAHGLEIRTDWLEVREVFDQAVASAQRRGATQTFHVVVPSHIPFLPADPILLDQALGNIVANAVRYAGAEAHITLEASMDDGAMVLSVTDDGPGIPPSMLPHVFEKFVRAPKAGDAGQSTGLGLAITKGVIEAHGGSVSACSPVCRERGTAIVLRLPTREGER